MAVATLRQGANFPLHIVYTYLHLSSSTPTHLISHSSHSQGHSSCVW